MASTLLLGTKHISCIVTEIQEMLATLGLHRHVAVVSMWVLFAGCGLAELLLSFLICTPLERFWSLTSWPKRHSIVADVAYALFVRIILSPLIAFFKYDWLRRSLDGFLSAHGLPTPTLLLPLPFLASWPLLVFLMNFAMLDFSDYWRHRLSHRYG